MSTKPTNPKDIVAGKKIDMGLVPDTLVVFAARAFTEGALKYGRFNWRIAGVAAHVYHAAVRRHISKWWNGQDYDKRTRVHHLDNAIACLAILRDAELYGKLNDNRPPCPDPDAMADLIDAMELSVEDLQQQFDGYSPYQYTIADTKAEQVLREDVPLGPTGQPLMGNEITTDADGCVRAADGSIVAGPASNFNMAERTQTMPKFFKSENWPAAAQLADFPIRMVNVGCVPPLFLTAENEDQYQNMLKAGFGIAADIPTIVYHTDQRPGYKIGEPHPSQSTGVDSPDDGDIGRVWIPGQGWDK